MSPYSLDGGVKLRASLRSRVGTRQSDAFAFTTPKIKMAWALEVGWAIVPLTSPAPGA